MTSTKKREWIHIRIAFLKLNTKTFEETAKSAIVIPNNMIRKEKIKNVKRKSDPNTTPLIFTTTNVRTSSNIPLVEQVHFSKTHYLNSEWREGDNESNTYSREKNRIRIVGRWHWKVPVIGQRVMCTRRHLASNYRLVQVIEPDWAVSSLSCCWYDTWLLLTRTLF